jgi:hypothetical protein
MHRSPHLLVAVAASVACASALTAQDGTVQVRGIVYDSVRSIPLAGALISIAGDGRTVHADGRGRFTFDGVPPGVHTFSAQHAALDSLGFTGITARTTIIDGRDDVRIASPSFSTLWRSVCGTTRIPNDSGFVYGTVRDAITQSATPNAIVDVTWLDLHVDRSHRITHALYHAQTRSDSVGVYYVCGVPRGTGSRIRAATDSSISGLVDLSASGLSVQRRDLALGAVGDSGATQFGVVTGFVIDSGGRPIVDARVVADGALEVRTRQNGAFIFPRVPAGTRQIEALAIGMSPVVSVVDVTPTDTASLLATMRKITTLDIVRVKASPMVRHLAQELEQRRASAFGYVRDSSQIANRPTLLGLMFEFPNVQAVQRRPSDPLMVTMAASGGGRCLAHIFIDGQRSDFERLSFIQPADIAVLEVYPRGATSPLQFGGGTGCGSVVVWTKWMLSSH